MEETCREGVCVRVAAEFFLEGTEAFAIEGSICEFAQGLSQFEVFVRFHVVSFSMQVRRFIRMRLSER